MLFNKKIEPSCSYCTRSTELDEHQVLCARKGLQANDGKCFWFRYDPCKRIPCKAKALDFTKYDEEDFSL